MKGYWTCRRKFMGKQCLTTNTNRKRNCEGCGKLRQKRKPPEHRAVLAMPYEWWVDRFGETCGICGKGPSAGRRLDRDHDHKSGAARGLLCHRHNRGLDWFADLDELRRAVSYLEIAERRRVAIPTEVDDDRYGWVEDGEHAPMWEGPPPPGGVGQ